MEVKGGIRNGTREGALETKASADDGEKARGAALAAGGVFTLTDEKGRRVLIPAAQIASVDLGREHARPVGCGVVTG